jgi:hypothetical protein
LVRPQIYLPSLRRWVDSEFNRRRFYYEDSREDEPAEFFVGDGCSFRSGDDAAERRCGYRYWDFYPGAEARIYAAGGNAGFDADLDAAGGDGGR